MKNLKFLFNGIKKDGILYGGHYSKGPWTEQSKLPQGTICIYAKDYKGFPNFGETIINESDIMTDYHETSRIYFKPNSPYYEMANIAYNKQKERSNKNVSRKRFS